MSYRRLPTVASEKHIQALDPEDTALSAPTADDEFHPGNRINLPRMLERAADSTAPNPICDPQGGNYVEGF